MKMKTLLMKKTQSILMKLKVQITQALKTSKLEGN